MPSSELDFLRTKARALPEAERAELAHDLMITLDGEPDPDAVSAWEHELMRRLAEVEQGNAQTVSRQEFMERLRSRIR